jgi:hypothetical protein
MIPIGRLRCPCADDHCWRAAVGDRLRQPEQPHQLRQGLMSIATGEDSVRLWVVPHRAPAAEQLGKPVETQVWEDKVI